MEDNKNKQSYGLESHFTEDVYFYKNVKISGKLDYDFSKLDNLVVNNLEVLGVATFRGPAYFYDNIYVEGNINAGIITARIRLDVGVGGTILTTSTGNIGINSTNPQQKLDVGGSAKIDRYIYDSANAPGKNGYTLARDENGIRWIPIINDGIVGPNPIGIPTDGIFVLDEGVPLYPS